MLTSLQMDGVCVKQTARMIVSYIRASLSVESRLSR
jgi:hypothetical protein